jgi:hypothetical protein
MGGTGSGGLKNVQAEPVAFVECPQCGFPLNTCFSEKHLADGNMTVVFVACSRCMWAERWGELKIQKEVLEDGARKSAVG